MAQKNQINIGGDAIGNTIVAGSGNRVRTHSELTLTKTVLPSADQVNISAEIKSIADLLQQLVG
ncbi:MAG: hypothetical protein JZU55_08120, partial [Afipia sp.]|nr:hypothetical protein [Afipia sp.]